jgi:uncharacterized protein with HEPN domain
VLGTHLRGRLSFIRLGEKAAELAPSQPWGDIRGMGNRLRHAYDRIDLDVLWNTIRDRLPRKEDVEQALLGLEAKGDRDVGGK